MSTVVSERPVLVNRSYAGQRVTGQQRYAAEIAARLLQKPGFRELTPSQFWVRATLRTWVWVQFVLPWLARGSFVLSMTSRAPLWRRRQILVVHDLFVLTNPEWFSRRYFWTHAPLLRSQIRSAAGIVAVSQPVADQLAEVYDGPVVVAANAPSEIFSKRDSSGETILADLGLTPNHYLLAVGSLDPRKNLRRLAKAYGRLTADDRAAYPLVVVGGGNAIFKQDDFVWPEGVVDAGYVSDEQLSELYRQSTAVVLVSVAEGFGLPLVEATAAGARSLVVSDIPVFRWICRDAAHYVDPLSVEHIADGLTAAIAGPPAGEMDLTRYSWEESAAVVDGLCAELIQSDGRRR